MAVMVRRDRSVTTIFTVDDAQITPTVGPDGGATLSVTAVVISSALSYYLGRRRNVFLISRADKIGKLSGSPLRCA